MSSTKSEIEVVFIPQIDDIQRVILTQRKWVFFGLGVIFALLCFGMIIFGILAASDPSNENHLRNALVMLTVMPFVAGLAYLDFRKVKKLAGQLLETAEETVYRLDEDGLTSDSDNAHWTIAWPKFLKVKETASDFIFFPQMNINFPIPKRFFKSDEDIRFLRTVLSKKLGNKAKLLKS